MSGKLHSSQSAGNLREWKKETTGIAGQTTHEHFRIVPYNDNICRVTITRAEGFENFSYAVVAEPLASEWRISEEENVVRLDGKLFSTVLRKKPFRLAFCTRAGDVINEDDPSFGTSWIGDQVTTYKKLQPEERFIGLGEKTGPLDRRGSGYVNWNTDNFGYGPGADPLYSSIPFYIGIHQGLIYGIFLDNTHKSFFNFGASNNRFSSFGADSGEMDYYFIFGDTISDIIQQYTHLTGRMEMPPKWSIGYQQCRYSYYPDKEVMAVAETFRQKDIPADAIVLDIHYMERYKIFTWNKKDFPDPAGMIQQLAEKGFQVVVMCDPGIKVEEGYHAYEDGVKHDVYLKYPDGTYYTGQVWPGWCHFPDFTNPKTREWWKSLFGDYVALGVKGFWNDMNEIATWGNMLPENIEFNFDGNKSTTRRGRNVYGFQMARSTYEGTKALMKNQRPFNLTRSGFAGIQRYAAVWTGDNVAYDEHMMLGVRIVNSMGVSGIAFAGYDIGGFVGNADSKLFARWLSIGAFSPFFRGHSMINSRDAEPWAYGEEVEQISRNYIKFRYQLMPYLYSLFHEASARGIPIQRALALEFPFDGNVFDHRFHHEYLFGPSLLVIPVESTRDYVKAYFPEADCWYSLYDGKCYAPGEMIVECPLHKLPVFVRGGAIIPMQAATPHSGVKPSVLDLHVYASQTPSAFTWYDDDGSTFEYQAGTYMQRMIEFDPAAKSIVIQTTEGSYEAGLNKIRLILHGFDNAIDVVQVNGRPLSVSRGKNRFFAGLEKYDPIQDPEPPPEENVFVADIDYISGEIIIKW